MSSTSAARGRTQEELAEAAGVHKNTVQNLESSRGIRIESLAKIYKETLKISPEEWATLVALFLDFHGVEIDRNTLRTALAEHSVREGNEIEEQGEEARRIIEGLASHHRAIVLRLLRKADADPNRRILGLVDQLMAMAEV